MLGSAVPADCVLARAYDGPLRIVVPAVRTSLEAGEPLSLKVLVLAKETPGSASIFWRGWAGVPFARVALEHKARGVFSATLPPFPEAIEYYIEVESGGETVRFPATAPARNQTVIVLPVPE